MIYSLLADWVVAVHLAYASFVLFGLIAVVLGRVYHWGWIQNSRFRIAHLICTAFVALEAALEVTCPLTTLENSLLVASGRAGYDRSFIGNLVNRILFYDAPEGVFTIIYLVLIVLVLLAYLYVPPSRGEAL